MTTRGIRVLAVIGVLLAGCAPPPVVVAGSTSGTLAFIGDLPDNVQLDMSGDFTLTESHDLHLALNRPCRIKSEWSYRRICNLTELETVHAVANTPWGQHISGSWVDSSHLAFHIDWKNTNFDPFMEDAADVLLRAWNVSGATWTPSTDDASELLRQSIATQIEVVTGGAPPKLEVTSFKVEGDVLRTEQPSTLLIRIANHGTGTAYRVVATLHSGITALHGQQLSFGAIKPGAEKQRRLSLTLPASETATTTMVVLSLTEGNGAAPPNLNRRMEIAHPVTAPALAMKCRAGPPSGRGLELDAGQYVEVRCQLQNTGNADAKQVDVEASLTGGQPIKLPVQSIAMTGKTDFSVPVVVPRDLAVDSSFEIAITARDRASSKSARFAIAAIVRKPRLCEPGKLTQAQYQAKLAELRNSTFLSAEEFDRYDAELVSCLR